MLRLAAPGMLTAVVLRFLYCPWYYPSGDDAAYSAIARSWSSPRAPYERYFVDRPPGMLVIARLFAPPSHPRVGFAVLNVVCLVVVAISAVGIARTLGVSSRACAMLSLLIVLTMGHPGLVGPYVSNESVEIAPAMLSVLLVLRGRAKPRSWLVLAGMSAGVAFSVKQSGVDVVGATGLLVAWEARRNVAIGAKRLAGFVAGFRSCCGSPSAVRRPESLSVARV